MGISFLVAVLGAIAGSLLTAVAPKLFGAARTGIPRVLGVIKLTHLRTAMGGLAGIMLSTGISLSTSNHGHRVLSYAVWYGLAGLSLVAVIALTVVIDRTAVRPEPTDDERPGHTNMNRLLRQQWHGARAAREQPEMAPVTADRQLISAGTTERVADSDHDSPLRSFDQDGKDSTAHHEVQRAPVWTPPPLPPENALIAASKKLRAQQERGKELMQQITRAQAEAATTALVPAHLNDAMIKLKLDNLTVAVETWATEITDDQVPQPPDGMPKSIHFARLAEYVQTHLQAPSKPEVPKADDQIEPRELLRLTLAVRTELESARYQLSQAKQDRRGWGNNHLPADKFSEWSASAIAAPQTDVRAALDGFYVWANAINQEIEQRAAREFSQVGQHLSGKTSALDDDDLSILDEGLSRIQNAQEHLDSLRDELRDRLS